MKLLKNILVGFVVSFIGSIPLGYLNIAGFELHRQSELPTTIWYLLGVVTIEVFVIYFTLVFANSLAANKKLMRFIEAFSIIFMLALAVYFYVQHLKTYSSKQVFWSYDVASPYVLGLMLSCVNFMQIPFWTGWNLYLINGNHIDPSAEKKYYYIIGTALGTFFGMLVFILSMDALEATFSFSGFISLVIAVVFGIMGIVQGWKFYRKYYASKKP